MAMVMLVAETDVGEPVVGPTVAEWLRSLGISRITLLRDASSTAVVLEGWAFDPSRSDEAIRAVFPLGSMPATFHEVEQVAVSTAHQSRETQRRPISRASGPST
jgi:hypothetical protein